jgi:hypothetical protein
VPTNTNFNTILALGTEIFLNDWSWKGRHVERAKNNKNE